NCLFALRSKRKGRSSRTAISSRAAYLAHKVHWTLCLKPNHALKELEMRYAISSSVKSYFYIKNIDFAINHQYKIVDFAKIC
ncbi:hypothetical protein HMPREF1582_01141, partial [Gardnerella vaginalis JCP8151A]